MTSIFYSFFWDDEFTESYLLGIIKQDHTYHLFK